MKEQSLLNIVMKACLEKTKYLLKYVQVRNY